MASASTPQALRAYYNGLAALFLILALACAFMSVVHPLWLLPSFIFFGLDLIFSVTYAKQNRICERQEKEATRPPEE